MIIKDVWNGWKNVFFKDAEIEKLAEERVKICNPCDTRSEDGHFCSLLKGGCGCPIISAIRSPDYKCIKGKW